MILFVGNQVSEPNVDILLDKMHSELLMCSKKKKNTEVIHLSAQISRALMGMITSVVFYLNSLFFLMYIYL